MVFHSNADRKNALCDAIVRELEADPDFLPSLIAAITRGQSAALAAANKRTNERDRAWLLTLCLWNGEKLTPKMREMMEAALLPILAGSGSKCAAEREALDRIISRQAQS